MNQQTHQSGQISKVRAVAKRFDTDAIEVCMAMALRGEDNPCYSAEQLEEVMNVLAKDGFVSGLLRQGLPMGSAIRELGKRVRAAQDDYVETNQS